jgi:hypothetical protein
VQGVQGEQGEQGEQDKQGALKRGFEGICVLMTHYLNGYRHITVIIYFKANYFKQAVLVSHKDLF